MFYGILIGAASFVSIGIFHPIVIKCEFYFSKKCWPCFLIAGILFCAVSCFTHKIIPNERASIVVSALLAVVGFSCLWSIHELFAQEYRVKRGWFPRNPHNHCHAHFKKEKDEEHAD